MLRELIWIVQKELRYALRDTDVLIYGVLTPLLIYPIVIVGISEAATWTAAHRETIKCCVEHFEQLPAHLKHCIEDDKSIKLVTTSSPMEDLKSKKVDLVIGFKEVEDKYVFDMYSRTRQNLDALKFSLVQSQRISEAGTYAMHKVPSDALKIYDIEFERLLPAAKGQAKVESTFPLLALLISSLGIVQGILTAAVSATCLLVEEREKNTYETMVTAPVPQTLLVAGKWLASTVLSVISGTIMTISLAIAAAGLLLLNSSIRRVGSVLATMIDKLLYVDWTLPLAFLAVVVGSAFASSVFMICCASAKTFKEGQAIATYPVTVLGLLPAIGLIPGIESRPWILLVPLLNITATIKHSQNELNIVIALLVTLIWAIVCCFMAGRIFLDEQGLISITLKAQRGNNRGDTV